jgi:acyl-CoA reductase-like NAD-dependent aldehyde dehydrogenase
MVHESHKQEFIDALLRNVKSMYSDHSFGGKGSPDMGNIVTDFHVDRIMNLVNGAKGKVICGGKMNKAAKYV